jgi:hypothetical protein
MKSHFVQLKLGNKTYKTKVSTDGCSDVADFITAIRASPQLPIGKGIITLFQPDGITEIDPGEVIEKLNEFNVGAWKPMVVTVEELPFPAPIGSTKKQKTYKGMSTEASCRKFLDALAIGFFVEYDFPKTYKKPTMGDLLAASRGKQGKREQTNLGVTWWDYRLIDGTPLSNEPLSSRLTAKQWKTLENLNRKISDRIHNAILPLTTDQKPFVVLPREDFMDKEIVNDLKSIAANIGVVSTEDGLIVKDEFELSGSSNSESGSPGKDMKL